MLIGVNDLAFLFDILSDDPCPDLISAAKKAKVSQIDIGYNMIIKLLEDMRQFEPAILNKKERKRFDILLEELEEATDLAVEGQKHPFFQELEEELKQQNFTSEKQLQEFIKSRNLKINNSPQNDLGGLTPKQLQSLFAGDWWEPDGPIKLSADIKQADAAAVPIVNNVGAILRSVSARSGRKGVKATVSGNLPRSVINDVIPVLLDTENHDSFHLTSGKKVFNEDDLYCLMMQRYISQTAGLLEQNDNYWQVTPKGMAMIEPGNAAALLVTLFAAMFRDFNLAFIDRYDCGESFQHTLPYSLWRLANLPSGKEYTTSELTKLVVHPDFLQRLSMPSYPGSTITLGQRVVESRLFRPLSWAGWLKPITGKNRFDIESYRVTDIPGRIFRAPNLPKPRTAKA